MQKWGRISVQGARIIYPQNVKEQSLQIVNSSTTASFLVQSWIEDAHGKKSDDFVVTPPLFLSPPRHENTLRLIFTGAPLPENKESLYYFVTKQIPSEDNETAGKSVLKIALATRIKLFFRPGGLAITREDAPSLLSFTHAPSGLDIYNPTPYYLTLTHLKAEGHILQDIMVFPGEHAYEKAPAGTMTIVFHSLDDYGTETKELQYTIKQ